MTGTTGASSDMTADWPQEFDQIMRRYCRFADPVLAIAANSSLTSLGIDSMGLINMIIAIEDTFAVTVPDEMLTSESLRTPGSVWAAVRDLINGADQA